jgi:hypothetical protein
MIKDKRFKENKEVKKPIKDILDESSITEEVKNESLIEVVEKVKVHKVDKDFIFEKISPLHVAAFKAAIRHQLHYIVIAADGKVIFETKDFDKVIFASTYFEFDGKMYSYLTSAIQKI